MTDTSTPPAAPPRVSGIRVPDVRGWALIGAIGLTLGILFMIYKRPALVDSASFMQLATLIISGTALACYYNLFGGTKSGADATKALADTNAVVAVQNAMAGTGTGTGAPQPGGTRVDAPPNSKVTTEPAPEAAPE
jgi:hypothetical protein